MSIYEHEVVTIDGDRQTLERYRGRVLLIVNVASECGFTPQYEGLELLWRRHRDAGLTILGFPCNQFGGQEPGEETQIARFCERNYGVSFPLFAKVDVNGRKAHPLYRELKRQAPGALGTKAIKWNFTKFLVGRGGEVVRRYAPQVTAEELEGDVVGVLQVKSPGVVQPPGSSSFEPG